MSSTPNLARARPSVHGVVHATATGLFVAVFLYSAVWSLVDVDGTRADTLALGFPAWTSLPLALAKLAGLAVILSRRFGALTWLAFAGFFYDVVLALGAHVAQRDGERAALALVGIAVTVAAYLVERRRRAALSGGTAVPAGTAAPSPAAPAR